MTKQSLALVTGADGFIGSHLVEYLLNKGCNVRAFCLYNSNGSWGWLDRIDKEYKKNIEVVLGDIRDPICVKNALKGCDHVYHLAALIAIPYSYMAPASYVETNIMGTLNVIQAARELDVSKVVHTSTSETYGTAQFVPITEDHPLVAQSPYAASKIGADQIALSYWRSFETPVSVIRPFNTYGPRQSCRAVIPTIITQIAGGEKRIKLGSTTPTRDFNFILDTCSAFYEVGKSEACVGQVVNAASNYEISIGETVSLIADAMGARVEISSEAERVRPERSEVNRLFGDNSRIKRLTEWRPKYDGKDGFKRGIARTVEWFTKPNNLALYKLGQYSI
ncbi:NAD-dependent 4,6-dehydratase LegB [Prochlorococcus marinus]|uniref:Nucleoside-diphosphate-sugar epimerase n=1 Tax=Prochlorococcus marinus (strain MIT 9303) TaxID=59922 RepID=A2C5V8_PROM3|nr:NAD-dependent 4,6-dehydratase LegB [Prochlorococcus marinus]ABM76868.1 Nucleoside-diphosphate-sugar epimerase [Prochlorococcus marinus str. MIT 9303]